MAYAAREGRLLLAVCLCGVGFSEGVLRPVRAWTAPRALAVLTAPQVVQAPQPWTALSLGAVIRPERSSAVGSCPLPRASPPHPHLPPPGGKVQNPSPAHLVPKRIVQRERMALLPGMVEQTTPSGEETPLSQRAVVLYRHWICLGDDGRVAIDCDCRAQRQLDGRIGTCQPDPLPGELPQRMPHLVATVSRRFCLYRQQ